MSKTRVCIIGAGPCGLSAIRAFTKIPESDQFEIVCYEKQNQIGGLWNASWKIGVDNHGNMIHSAQYHHLFSNGPAEIIEYYDYFYQDHFGKKISSFPPGRVVADYIKGRFASEDITSKIVLNANVDFVEPFENKFRVKVSCYSDETSAASCDQKIEVFDKVIVANGHFNYPNVAFYPGYENFKGSIIHSKDFRNGEAYKDRDVLLIGSSYSAEDIAVQCYKYGAKHLYLSYRPKHPKSAWCLTNFPDEKFTRKGVIKDIDGNAVTFADGSVENIDAIIICTGYNHKFKFLHKDLDINAVNRLSVENLYVRNREKWFQSYFFRITFFLRFRV